MDKILKLVMFARKHPEMELHERFQSLLPANVGDKYERAIEASKVNYIKFLCTHLDMSTEEVLSSYKYAKKFKCLTMNRTYQKAAKQLLKEGKQNVSN